MERSVYFLIGPHDTLAKRDSTNEQNSNTNANGFATSIDGNTNLISDTYNISQVTLDTNGNVINNNSSKFVGVRSLFNTTFVSEFNDTMSTEEFTLKSHNYINYRGLEGSFDPTKTSGSGLGTPQQIATSNYGALINWTSTKAKNALRLRPSDLVYHKDFGLYPPNRMLIVRRFASATPHDLFKVTAKATSTMVTWVKPEDPVFSISFYEKWKTSDESLIAVINDVIGFTGIKLDDWGTVSSLDQVAWLAFANKILGITGDMKNPLGNPNMIHQAAIRETDFKGLHSEFTVEFKAEYEFKYIDGVDPNLAYLDIIANCTRMATSDSEFVFNAGFGKNASDLITNVENGNWNAAIQSLVDGVNNLISGITSKFQNTSTPTSGSGISSKSQNTSTPSGGINSNGETILNPERTPAVANAQQNSATTGNNVTTTTNSNTASNANPVNNILTNISKAANAVGQDIKQLTQTIITTTLSKYKWRLTGAVASMSGMPTAYWHVTMGNPMCPWFSCGNMYIDDMTLDFPTDEMSYSDMPQRIKVSAKFKPGRVMGAYEIQQLFNAGKDRIYKNAPQTQIAFVPPSTSKTPAMSNPSKTPNTGTSDIPAFNGAPSM